MELDRRRFRANILAEPDSGEPFAEDTWIGERLTIGEALVEVVVNTERCAVTTFDPDTGERHPDVLRPSRRPARTSSAYMPASCGQVGWRRAIRSTASVDRLVDLWQHGRASRGGAVW